MNDKKDISKLFRNRLKDYDQPVDDSVWTEIDHDLKERKSRRYWIGRISSITSAAMFVLILGTTLLLKDSNISKNGSKQQKYTNIQQNKELFQSEENKQLIAADIHNSTGKEKTGHETVADHESLSIKKEAEQSVRTSISFLPGNSNATAANTNIGTTTQKTTDTVPHNKTAATPDTAKEPDRPGAEKKEDQPIAVSGDTTFIDNLKHKTGKQENLALYPELDIKSLNLAANKNNYSNISYALAVGNGSFATSDASYLSNTKKNYNSSPSLDNDNDPTTESPGLDNNNNNTENSQPAEENNTSYKEVDVKYNIPIVVSFSVRKHLTEKWALESGLTYSYLSSTETYEPSSLSRDIQLSYLGIPVKAIYSFYNYKNLSVYTGAGGMGEMCLSGKSTYLESKSSNKLNISEIQWSVFGNIGVNYRLINHLGLFLEPGLSYHFDDGSNVNTIRKDKPFNFNIQAGIRLSY